MTVALELVVGIGNTTMKLGMTGRRDNVGWPQWNFRHEFPTTALSEGPIPDLELPSTSVRWHVASVHRVAERQLRQWVATHRPEDSYTRLQHHDFPIAVQVDEPHRVGLDRLAAAVAVNALRSDGPAVFIDAGTAITINLVSHSGAFEGGVILPGFGLTAKALATGTDQLPLVMPDPNAGPPELIGKNTDAAIRSGLFWGNVGAVREIVDRITEELHHQRQSDSLVPQRSPQLFVTGGDAQRLTRYISPEAQFIPDLVLAGIVFTVSSWNRTPNGD